MFRSWPYWPSNSCPQLISWSFKAAMHSAASVTFWAVFSRCHIEGLLATGRAPQAQQASLSRRNHPEFPLRVGSDLLATPSSSTIKHHQSWQEVVIKPITINHGSLTVNHQGTVSHDGTKLKWRWEQARPHPNQDQQTAVLLAPIVWLQAEIIFPAINKVLEVRPNWDELRMADHRTPQQHHPDDSSSTLG